MRSERKYPLSIAILFSGSVSSLLFLTRKFAYLTLEHFLETCRQVANTLLTSGPHFIGFILLVSVLLVAFTFFAKTLASFIKTKRKIEELMDFRTEKPFVGLIKVLVRFHLPSNIVIVVDKKDAYAFSFGIFSQKIIISTGLIDKLSQKELEAVILHEFHHLRCNHMRLLISGEIAAATVFFLPVMKDLVRRMRTSFEKEADLFATIAQGTTRHLRRALAKNLAANNQYEPFPAFAEEVIGERVNNLVNIETKLRMPKRNIFVSLIVASLGLLLFIYPTSTHATSQTKPVDKEVSACDSNQCSSHCLTDRMAIDKA